MCFFLCGFGSRPAFGLRLLDTFRIHIEHWTFVLFLSGFGFGPASGLRFLDMIRDHVEPRTFPFFFFRGLNWTGYWLYGFCLRQGSTPRRVSRDSPVRRVMSSFCVVWPLETTSNIKKRVVKGLVTYGLGADYSRSSLLSIPQTDIFLFIQLIRHTVYFRLQIYFNETKILNKLRRFKVGEAKS